MRETHRGTCVIHGASQALDLLAQSRRNSRVHGALHAPYLLRALRLNLSHRCCDGKLAPRRVCALRAKLGKPAWPGENLFDARSPLCRFNLFCRNHFRLIFDSALRYYSPVRLVIDTEKVRRSGLAFVRRSSLRDITGVPKDLSTADNLGIQSDGRRCKHQFCVFALSRAALELRC